MSPLFIAIVHFLDIALAIIINLFVFMLVHYVFSSFLSFFLVLILFFYLPLWSSLLGYNG